MTAYKSIFPLLLDIDTKEIPTFIPTFNQPDLLNLTLKEFLSRGHTDRIVIYDNNSTYEPMIKLLDSLSDMYDVVRSSVNTGPRIFTEDLQILNLMPEYFIVTDPDLIHNKDLPEKYISEMKELINSMNVAKAGFAIEIHNDEERERFLDADSVSAIEERYWQEKVGITSTKDTIFNAAIDTTFSLNKRDACAYHRKFGKPTWAYPSIRIGGKYTCQHIGWWKKELMPQSVEEKEFYYKNQTWSHTERYYYK